MRCPDCGTTVHGVETRAPGAHVFDPCGCATGAATADDIDRGRGLATDGGVPDSTNEASDRTIDVYLGKVRNAWGRSDELVAGTMAKAKTDVEARARELASYIDNAHLPDDPEWRAHIVEEGTQVWDVDDWQIVVQTHEIADRTEGEP